MWLRKLYQKNVTTLLSGQAARIVFGFVSSLILVWFLGVEERGKYALIASGVAIASAVLDFGMPSTFWILAGLNPEEKPKVLAICLFSCLISPIIVVGLFCAFDNDGLITKYFFDAHPEVTFLAGIWIILTSTFNNLSGFIRGLGNFKIFRNVVAGQSFFILIGFSIGYLLELSLITALSTNCCALALCISYLLNSLFRDVGVKLSIETSLLKNFIRTSASYYLVVLGSIFCVQSPILILGSFGVAKETIAEFAVAYALILILESLPTAIVSAYMPKLAEVMKRNPSNSIGAEVARIARVTTLVIFFLIVFLLIPGIVLIIGPLYGEGFERVPFIFMILLGGVLVAGNGKILSLQFNLSEKPRLEVFVVWLRLIVQSLILILLVSFGNIYIFSLGIVVARVFRISFTFYLFRKETGIKLSDLIPRNDTFRFLKETVRKRVKNIA